MIGKTNELVLASLTPVLTFDGKRDLTSRVVITLSSTANGIVPYFKRLADTLDDLLIKIIIKTEPTI